MYAGNSYWSAVGANAVSNHANRKLMKEPGWGTLQHYYSIPYYTAVKFARWSEILNMENADSSMKYPEAVRHFARGMAFLGKNDLIKLPKNGWAIKGLQNAYDALDLDDFSVSMEEQFRIAWISSDMEIEASRIW